MTKSQRERLRRKRQASRLAALADAVDPRMVRSPNHLTSSERAFIGRTWKAADAARSTMSAEKKATLDDCRAAFPTI